jgi:uncharacterized protein YjiS (DUF1127 family)
MSQVLGTRVVAANSWARLWQQLVRWHQARQRRVRVTLELMSYDDRELFDIGITRDDIPAVVAGTLRR